MKMEVSLDKNLQKLTKTDCVISGYQIQDLELTWASNTFCQQLLGYLPIVMLNASWR